MTESKSDRRKRAPLLHSLAKPLLFVLALLPLGWLMYGAVTPFWPIDEPDGKLLSLETPQLRTGAGIGPSGGGPSATEAAMRETMCRDMAVRIVKLFRKWTPDFDDGGASQSK